MKNGSKSDIDSRNLGDPSEEIRDQLQELAKLQMRDEIESVVRMRIDEEKKRLQSYWALARFAFGAVVVVVGFIGWQSWNDITARVDKRVDTRLNEHLKDSPPAKYEKDVERLYDQVIVSSYLSQIPRNPVSTLDRFSDMPSLLEQDLVRLVTLLALPETKLETCQRILRILEYYHGISTYYPGQSPEIRKILMTEPSPEWIASTPKRLAYLIKALTVLKDRDAASIVRRILARRDIDGDIQIAALEYIREMFLFEGRSEVESLLEMGSIRQDVKISALRTLAVIAPDAHRISSLIANLRNPTANLSPDDGDIFTFLAIVGDLNRLGPSNSVRSWDETQKRMAISQAVLERMMTYEYHLEWTSDRICLNLNSPAVEKQTVPLDVLQRYELVPHQKKW